MSFDALTLAAVRDELAAAIVGGQVQKLLFVDGMSMALGVFTPGHGRSSVLLVARPEDARVHLAADMPARGLERDTPFSLLARKHVRDARVREIRQPPHERVLEVELERRDDDGRHYRVLLIVEVMGRRSNLVLVDEAGTILDAARRSPPSRNPVRPVLPHQPYVFPPAQARTAPERAAAGELALAARGKGGTLAAFLQASLDGLSPLAAREAAFRATGSATTGLVGVDWERVVQAIDDLVAPLRTGQWRPTLALLEGLPLDFAAFEPHHLAARGATLEPRPTMSAAIDELYAAVGRARTPDAVMSRGPFEGEKRGLRKALATTLGSAERRIGALQRQLSETRQADALRRAGEAILTHQWQMETGQPTWRLDDGTEVALDPQLTPSENAQRYFARYRKAREGAEALPALLEQATQAQAHLADLAALVDLAADQDALRALRREVAEATGKGDAPGRAQARTRHPSRPTRPYRRHELGSGWEALVGGSAQGNAAVTFDLAGPDDLWLHARGVPGAHVILRGARGGPPDDETLRRAAEIAAWHSTARGSGQVEVDWAPRRQVKKIPGAAPGLVRYSGERTIRVEPRGVDRDS